MWRIWSKLFGWHYVALDAGRAGSHIKKVHLTPNSEMYVDWEQGILFLNPDGTVVRSVSDWSFPWTWFPLTWDDEKIKMKKLAGAYA